MSVKGVAIGPVSSYKYTHFDTIQSSIRFSDKDKTREIFEESWRQCKQSSDLVATAMCEKN